MFFIWKFLLILLAYSGRLPGGFGEVALDRDEGLRRQPQHQVRGLHSQGDDYYYLDCDPILGRLLGEGSKSYTSQFPHYIVK